MKFSKRNSTVVGFAAMSLAVMTMLAATTMVASIPKAKAQLGNGQPPISVVGNPNDLSTGPPIPSCQIAGLQGVLEGPVSSGHIEGCKGTP